MSVFAAVGAGLVPARWADLGWKGFFKYLGQAVNRRAGLALQEDQFTIAAEFRFDFLEQTLFRLVVVAGERMIALETPVTRLALLILVAAHDLPRNQILDHCLPLSRPPIPGRQGPL